MLKRAQALFLRCLGAISALVLAGRVSAESATSQLNMPQGVTEVSQAAYDIHMIMMWICTAIGIAVFGFMFYVMYAHRKSRGAVAENFHENVLVELLWTIVPAIILIVMAVPATTALLKVMTPKKQISILRSPVISGIGSTNIWVKVLSL